MKKIAKSNPAVAQWLSASLGALVNHGLGKSPITGAAEAQYGTKWNFAGAVVRLGVSTSKIAVDTTSGEIISVFRKGYKIKDRIIRHAMVIVAK